VISVTVAFGRVVIPEPVRQMALSRALRKYRTEGALKVHEYRSRLIYRWARGTAYYLWKMADERGEP
jgi:hypothetical protein